jgi:hypothetical protein
MNSPTSLKIWNYSNSDKIIWNYSLEGTHLNMHVMIFATRNDARKGFGLSARKV